MLPRERVFTALDHREPDIVPWGEHWIDYNVYEDILGRRTYVHAKFRERQALWQGMREDIVSCYKKDVIELADALGLDIITVEDVPPKEIIPVPMKQIDDTTYQDENGDLYRVSSVTNDLLMYKQKNPVECPALEELQDKIDSIDNGKVPWQYDSIWDVARHVVRERKKTHFIAIISQDISWPSFDGCMSQEDAFANLALYPEMHAKISELNAKRAIAYLKKFAELGVDGVIPCGDLGTSQGLMANPKIYVEHIFPWNRVYCEEAHRLGLKVLKHCCGRIWDVLDYFVKAGYDAYEAIQSSAGMDIKILKERYGDKLTLWGGVTNENLIGGTVVDVHEDARYSLKWAAPGGGYIYGASHSLAVGASREKILAMKDAREKWGCYPIRIN